MEKKLGFAYVKAPYRYVAKYSEGRWHEGYLTTEENLVVNESAAIFQYAQQCFEGLKARRTRNGDITIFRPDMNAERMYISAERICMPPYPKEDFLKGVMQAVEANKELIPSYESGGSLYIRPFMVGTGTVLGVLPAAEYEFRIYVSPVGPYFQGGKNAVDLRVCDVDRVAPNGTGHVKAGLNYAMSLQTTMEAHRLGYDENLYLDAATRTYIEETGGANILFVTKAGELVTPQSGSILPSITKRSLLEIAERYLGIKATERPVRLSELGDFTECGLCGTAAVISPVRSIDDHGTKYTFFGGEYQEDSLCGALRRKLTAIQNGEEEGPEGWVVRIKG